MLLRHAATALLGFSLACGPTATPEPPTLPASGPVADPTPTPIAPPAKASIYPAARRGDVVDTYHGTTVADPYRWLEDPDSDETGAWIAAQKTLTDAYLASVPARARVHARLSELWNYERYGLPTTIGGRTFYQKNDGLQNQSVMYWARSPTAKPNVLLDPNTWSKDGTVALAGTAISDNGRYVAYGVARSGSDWRQWKVHDIKTGADTADVLEWIKFSGVSWSKDSKGFYYSRFPAPADGQKLTEANINKKVYYHRLGTPQAADTLIYENPAEPKWSSGVGVTEDGRYLVLYTSKGTGRVNLLHIRDLRDKKGTFVPIVTDWIGQFSVLANDGPRFLIKTTHQAERGKVIAIDVRKPGMSDWKDVVAEQPETLRSASVVGNTLLARYMVDATSQVRTFTLKGKRIRDVALPGVGSAGGFGGRRRDRETFYTYTSYTEPSSIYRYNLKTGKSSLFRKPEVKFDGSAFETRQVFFKSKDGTRVPMFIVAKKGVKLDGNNPTLLYGYGGFNVSMTPAFSVTRAVWLEMGGVLAVANLRGGGEYGEAWHHAGTKLKKQNVFDDFIAAAEYLIAQKITRSSKLAIQGGSNGGLLVGAVANQRPELFGAAIPAVGVMDMLRFHKFTIGWAWVDDYGSSEDPAEFKALRAYSPYHNLVKGTRYPTTMVMTADHDDRVVPGHSFKYAAALQHAHGGDNPVMIRIESKAGHGAGKPTSKKIDSAADIWAFLIKALDFEPTL